MSVVGGGSVIGCVEAAALAAFAVGMAAPTL